MTGTHINFRRTLVVAPHPDDEVLGAGGTIARLASEGEDVFVAIVTEGTPPRFDRADVTRTQAEAAEAHRVLGVKETFWLRLPAAQLGEVPHATVNGALLEVVRRVCPQTVLLPFVGDLHADHRLTFTSGLVACRPHQIEFPKLILAYETLSETNWNAPYVSPAFVPNFFVDITNHLETKMLAMEMFSSQLREPPHERSLPALRALATLRGATVMVQAAEAFVLVRHIA
ncbi:MULTISPECIES: PIG-L deacetylase family protein [Neorhizobium]|jgi:LmbE family N-acetylglucosaminyl deacetylase|uniref:PIG-L deacetylase family protein n=1 Tax=Neorhizobium sp. T6_25 TaxID=2093833 RepID=UPI000CFA6583|nr:MULTISPECIES: PIG-L deacetylase family protein [Neorhizobium]